MRDRLIVDGTKQLRIRWFGHATFSFDDGRRVFVDPFAIPDPPEPGISFDYPALEDVAADVLLVTHEHRDHNAVSLVGGNPHLIRSSAGTFESPIGTVVGIASEHDDAAGTQRGANVMYRFSLGGLSLCHAGDLGQSALREEQRRALDGLDVLFLPVGGRQKVLDGETAASIVRTLRPRTVVPMHYGTWAVNYMDTVDGFVAAMAKARIERLDAPGVEWRDDLLGAPSEPVVLIFAPPR